MTPQWGGLHLQKAYAHQTREGDDLLERLLLLKPHNTLITGSTRGHTTISKIVISLFTKFMATKLGMMLTSQRKFSMQMLKLPPTPCFFCSFLVLFFDTAPKVFHGLFYDMLSRNHVMKIRLIYHTKKFFCENCSSSCYLRHVWHMTQLIQGNQHLQHPKKHKKQP